MAQQINTKRELDRMPTLTWEDKWFRIANEEVIHLANGVNIVDWETRDKIFADMNYQRQSMDWQINVAEVSAVN